MTIATDIPSISSRSEQDSRIAANWLSRLQRCLADDGASRFQSALRETGISQHDIDRAENILLTQLDQVSRVIRADVPDITLRMISMAELVDHGLTGYAAMNSGSVGRALEVFYKNHSLTSGRYIDQLERVGDDAVVTAIPKLWQFEGIQTIAKDSFTSNWRSLQILLGPVFDPSEILIYFQHVARVMSTLTIPSLVVRN